MSHVKRFFVLTGGIVLLYVLKQYFLFGITSTSSFTGLNLCQSIQACQPHAVDAITNLERSELPSVLTRDKKLTGAHNFNNRLDLDLNQSYADDFKNKLSTISISELIRLYKINIDIYLRPSSGYASTNVMLTNLPERWRIYWEKLFSAPLLPILLILSSIFWMVNTKCKKWRQACGVAIPVLLIFIISVLFESGENMRFKFFIEPIIFIYIASQLYAFFAFISRLIYPKTSQE